MTISRPALLKALFQAYRDTRESKRYTLSQLEFEFDYEHYLRELCDAILLRAYKPGYSTCFISEEPVKREIFASCFSHRVVCRLLYNLIAPIFDARMIDDSFSCRVGKGVWKGIERMQHHIRSCTNNYRHDAYALTADFQGYFMSIKKTVLFDIITKRLDKVWEKPCCRGGKKWSELLDRTLIDYLLHVILFRNPTEDCIVIGRPQDWVGLPKSKTIWGSEEGIGLAIGDITSQLFSNILLDILDQYIKRELKCKWYGRYVDDFTILHRDKKYLLMILRLIREFVQTELQLTLHPRKVHIVQLSKGFTFLGAYFLPYRIYPSKRSVARFHKRIYGIERFLAEHPDPGYEYLCSIRSCLNSYCGHFSKFKAWNMLDHQFGPGSGSPLREYFRFTPDYSKAILKRQYQKPRSPLIGNYFPPGLAPWEYGWESYYYS